MRSRSYINGFTVDEWPALEQVRHRYQHEPCIWTERELAQLRFMQWLVQTGRLLSDAGPDVDPKKDGDSRWRA